MLQVELDPSKAGLPGYEGSGGSGGGSGGGAGGGTYDVVKDYSWTSVPRNSELRFEAPSAQVRSFELKESQLRAFASGYLNIADKNAQQDPMTFYDNLYKTKGEVTNYRFPYFEDNFRAYSNDYADTFSQISQRGAQFLGAPLFEAAGAIVEEVGFGAAAAATQVQGAKLTQLTQKAATASATVSENIGLNKFLQGVTGNENYQFRIPAPGNPGDFPGSYIETPKFYQYANTDAGVQINFVLANTVQEDDVEKNQALIKNIIAESRPRRGSTVEMTFPRIYEVTIPGLRYIRWAYLANAAFNLVGARRQIYTGGGGDGKIVPEAYAISLTFNSLTIESENFIERAGM